MTLGSLIGAAVLLAVFLVIERRHRAPLLRLGVFRIRSLAVANAAMFVYFGATVAVAYFTTIYLQEVWGYSPLQAGLAFLPSSASVFAGTMLTKRQIGVLGLKPMLGAALLVSAVGTALMTRITVGGSYASDVLPTMIVFYTANGVAMMALTMLGTLNVGGRDAGLASGLITSSKQIGAAVWVAVLITLAAAHAARNRARGDHPRLRLRLLADHRPLAGGRGARARGACATATRPACTRPSTSRRRPRRGWSL